MDQELKRKIAGWSHRVLAWGRDHVPPGLRTVLGVLFMIGGVLGFLPILGFWMLPLGAALIALDFPPAHRRIHDWIEELEVASRPPEPVCSPVDEVDRADGDRR